MDFLEISEYNKSILIGLYLNRADDMKYVMLKDVDPNNKPKGLRLR